jgi:hypothetical protein
MTRARWKAGLGLLLLLTAAPARAQDTQSLRRAPEAARPHAGSVVAVGALTGAGLGAAGAAAWSTFGEDGMVPEAAGAGAALGAASGAVTGAAIALAPQPRGWKKYALAAAIGAAVSGTMSWALGEWAGTGTVEPGRAATAGIGHGAITAAITIRLAR